jgi:predicted nucleotidyltransferase component of viral defense system
MIPQAYITEWSHVAPWPTDEQVEQDLVISRALVAIYSDDFLAERLAFRGGTALHKLYLQPQPRYSEDIDLVQVHSEPIKPTIQRIQKALDFLGPSSVAQKKANNTIRFRFESEIPPTQTLRLKIEINCREHFSALGFQKRPFSVQSSWFKGDCEIRTYRLEELLGSKLRALYQRNKGRDLYDLYRALTLAPTLDAEAVLQSYRQYMAFAVRRPPTAKQFLLNLEAKMSDSEFLGDTTALLRPEEAYYPEMAFAQIKSLIEKI